MTIIITEMMTCNEVETKAGHCSPQELTGVHAAQPSCTLGRLLVNIDMLLLVMRMMSIDTVDRGDEADDAHFHHDHNS